MELVNCELVEDVSFQQTPGVDDIGDYVLYIKPDTGYTVAASDFTDYTAATFPTQGSLSHNEIFASIELFDFPATGGDNWVKVVVDFVDTYSIDVDTTLSIDIGGDARLATKSVICALVEEVSNTLEGSSNVATVTVEPADDVTYTESESVNNILETVDQDQVYYFTTEVTPGTQKRLATVTFTTTDLEGGIHYFDGAPYEFTDQGDKFEWVPSVIETPNITTVSAFTGAVVFTEYIFDLMFTEPLDAAEASISMSGGDHDELYTIAVQGRVTSVMEPVVEPEPEVEVPPVGDVWYAVDNPYSEIYDGVVTERIQANGVDDTGGVTGFITLMEDSVIDGVARKNWSAWEYWFSNGDGNIGGKVWPDKTQLDLMEGVHTTLEAATDFIDFTAGSYWSSSEDSSSHAWRVSFIDGEPVSSSKWSIFWARAIIPFSTIPVRGGTFGNEYEITNVTTNLNEFPNGSSNVIPASGITKDNPPRVDVYGVPGSSFSVTFRETAVMEVQLLQITLMV